MSSAAYLLVIESDTRAVVGLWKRETRKWDSRHRHHAEKDSSLTIGGIQDVQRQRSEVSDQVVEVLHAVTAEQCTCFT